MDFLMTVTTSFLRPASRGHGQSTNKFESKTRPTSTVEHFPLLISSFCLHTRYVHRNLQSTCTKVNGSSIPRFQSVNTFQARKQNVCYSLTGSIQIQVYFARAARYRGGA